ncbi:hypothetical protein ES695_17760 [Candidatus Atribacteria bacterium 1244-E10-H5-B2]|nr:MAG: hypothetical protein ES695_17760 [Candidatus Atribacteria bacterium 1244-E10-H5-B2]
MLNKRILVLMFLLVFLLLVGCFPAPPNQAPIITSTPITTATVGVLYTYNVNATDPDDDALTYSLITKPSGMIINSVTGVIFWTPTAKGNYSVVVKISDGALYITQGFTIAVSELPPVNRAPVIHSAPIIIAISGELYTYDVDAIDPDGDTLAYSLNTYTSMIINSTTGLISWFPTVIGSFPVIVQVSDGELYDTQSFTITVIAGKATKLLWFDQPLAEVTAGVITWGEFTIEITDKYGNRTSNTYDITIAASGGTGGTLSENTTVAAVAGLATFNGITYTLETPSTEETITISGSATGLTSTLASDGVIVTTGP